MINKNAKINTYKPNIFKIKLLQKRKKVILYTRKKQKKKRNTFCRRIKEST